MNSWLVLVYFVLNIPYILLSDILFLLLALFLLINEYCFSILSPLFWLHCCLSFIYIYLLLELQG